MKNTKNILLIFLSVFMIAFSVSCTDASAHEMQNPDIADINSLKASLEYDMPADGDISLDDVETLIAKVKEMYSETGNVKLSYDGEMTAAINTDAFAADNISKLSPAEAAVVYNDFQQYQNHLFEILVPLLPELFGENACIFNDDENLTRRNTAPISAWFALDMKETGCKTAEESVENGHYLILRAGKLFYMDNSSDTPMMTVFPTAEDQQISETLSKLKQASVGTVKN